MTNQRIGLTTLQYNVQCKIKYIILIFACENPENVKYLLTIFTLCGVSLVGERCWLNESKNKSTPQSPIQADKYPI